MDYIFEFPVNYSGVDERSRFERDLKKVESNIIRLIWLDDYKVFVKTSKEIDVNEIHRKLWKETGDDFTYPFVGYVAKVK